MIRKACFLILLSLSCCHFCLAEEASRDGTIIANGINIRSDSRVSSEVISTLKAGERVTIIGKESYGWYKMILPKNAPLFVRKDLAERTGENTAKITKSRVNLRLRPSEESPILGSIAKDQTFKILSEENNWYKIEPTENSFGWVNKDFVKLLPYPDTQQLAPTTNAPAPKENEPVPEVLNLEGTLTASGGIFKQPAPYKIKTLDKKTYFVKAKPGENLDSFLNQRVKLTAKTTPTQAGKYLLLEAQKIEKAQ